MSFFLKSLGFLNIFLLIFLLCSGIYNIYFKNNVLLQKIKLDNYQKKVIDLKKELTNIKLQYMSFHDIRLLQKISTEILDLKPMGPSYIWSTECLQKTLQSIIDLKSV